MVIAPPEPDSARTTYSVPVDAEKWDFLEELKEILQTSQSHIKTDVIPHFLNVSDLHNVSPDF